MSDQIFNDQPDILDASQIASALRISRAGAYNLLSSEDFPTLHIGRRKLVMKNDLIQWLKSTPTRHQSIEKMKGNKTMIDAMSDTISFPHFRKESIEWRRKPLVSAERSAIPFTGRISTVRPRAPSPLRKN